MAAWRKEEVETSPGEEIGNEAGKVVDVVDSHVQRIVLATEETTVTQ